MGENILKEKIKQIESQMKLEKRRGSGLAITHIFD